MGSVLKIDNQLIRHLLLLSLGLSIAAPVIAKKPTAPLSPLQKISQSFSDDKLGRTTMPKGAKLMQNALNNPECSPQKLADCYVIDSDGVELYYSPYDGLNSKQITIDDGYLGMVRVLGIGRARSKKDVLAAAARFVPFLSFDCAPAGRSDTPKTNHTSCVANIPKKKGAKALAKEQDPASVELLFDANDRIKTVQVIQSYYID
jgi:hypothetical protein